MSVRIVKTEPWGQITIRFYDPDGHLIEIGETMEVFILRIYKETDSIQTTSQRTGVSMPTIMDIIDKAGLT